MYSPDFKLKKHNNYDNTVKYLQRSVLEKGQIQKTFDRIDDNVSKEIISKLKGTKLYFSIIQNFTEKKTASYGAGNTAYLYTITQDQKGNTQQPSPSKVLEGAYESKLDYKKHQKDAIKNWNHYDSSMNNNLVEQRKILYSKNYELDSRAWALKDFGVQPFINTQFEQSRRANQIQFDQIRGKSHDERVPAFKKNYTPITTYMKSLYDSRVTKEGAGKITSLRPYLNYS